jgi:ParB-like chromosome segregation protein Spo0J
VRLSPPELRALAVHRCAGLFPVLVGEQRDELRASMRRHGFDETYPIVVRAETREIVDGRNRRDLACELHLTDVPVVEREFANEAEVAAFIVSANLARRHLDRGERRELAARLVNGNGYSTRKAARLAGVSQKTAQRAAVEQRASESNDSVAARRARLTKADSRVVSVRRALGVLRRMADEPIPSEVEEALTEDERVALVVVLDALTGRAAG